MPAEEARELFFLPEDDSQEELPTELRAHEPAHKTRAQAAPGIDPVIHRPIQLLLQPTWRQLLNECTRLIVFFRPVLLAFESAATE